MIFCSVWSDRENIAITIVCPTTISSKNLSSFPDVPVCLRELSFVIFENQNSYGGTW
jgi:hypothetical protein